MSTAAALPGECTALGWAVPTLDSSADTAGNSGRKAAGAAADSGSTDWHCSAAALQAKYTAAC